ncbi:MAG TPA: AAA family ATPase [Oculatellaceae cyanobacterium]
MISTTIVNNGQSPASPTLNYQKQLADLQKELNAVFLERGELIKLMLTSIIAKANGFMGGPPGTGKTQLTKAVVSAFGGFSFYYLLNSTTTPDEIIGAIDLVALQNGQFQKDLDRKLVTADSAIFDEIFKANSPVLNSTLGIILDKEFVNGKQTVQCPLNSLWGCSNELPQDESLAALWDRLALRFWVHDVARPAKKILMMRRANVVATPKITVQFTLTELQDIQLEAIATQVDETIIDCILDISGVLEKDGITASTRKHQQIIDLIRCYAYVCGDRLVDEEHLEVLEHIFWNKPEERAVIKKAIKQFGNPLSTQAQSILEAALQVQAQITPPSAGMNRGQWMRDIGSIDMQLGEMETKLEEMIDSTQKVKRVKKAQQVKQQIADMREQIQTMIQKAYNLPSK